MDKRLCLLSKYVSHIIICLYASNAVKKESKTKNDERKMKNEKRKMMLTKPMVGLAS